MTFKQQADIINDNFTYLNEIKQNIITDLDDIRSNAQTGADLAPQVSTNTERIEEIIVSRFPNVTIVGTPHIEGGQVSNYSATNYLQFPFIDISRGQPFDIYFVFTTSDDVTTQQNILDSHFGIALAVQNGKGIIALSSNGSSWDIGSITGTNAILPNTTYYAKLSWSGTEYTTALSTNDTEYVPDMRVNSNLTTYKTTIFIGGSPNIFGSGTAHPFKGTINFNKAKVIVNNLVVWQGMEDVGLATRANVSLDNLDDIGNAKFTTLGAELDYENNELSLLNTNGEILSSVTIEASSGTSYHPPLLSHQFFQHRLNDIQYLRADTFSWQSGKVYVASYEKLVEEYNNGETRTEGLVTYKLSPNDFKIADASQENNIMTTFSRYGEADFFILDIPNERFKLPRFKPDKNLLESYVSGSNGYRIYNDGYCEQWGTISSVVQNSYTAGTINLPKTFADTNYNVQITQNDNGQTLGTDPSTNGNAVHTKTPSSFTINAYAWTYGRDWIARGYLADNQYNRNSKNNNLKLYYYVGSFDSTGIIKNAGINTELFNSKQDINTDNVYMSYAQFGEVSGNTTISLQDTVTYYDILPVGATSITFDTTSLTSYSSKVVTFELAINMTTTQTISFTNSITWLNDDTPDLSTSGTHLLVFRHLPYNNTWIGSYEGKI